MHSLQPTKRKRLLLLLFKKKIPIPIQIATGKEKNNMLNGDQANQSLKTQILESHVPRKIWSRQNTMWEAWSILILSFFICWTECDKISTKISARFVGNMDFQWPEKLPNMGKVCITLNAWNSLFVGRGVCEEGGIQNHHECQSLWDPIWPKRPMPHWFNVSQKKLQPNSLSKAQFSLHFSQQTTPLQLNWSVEMMTRGEKKKRCLQNLCLSNAFFVCFLKPYHESTITFSLFKDISKWHVIFYHSQLIYVFFFGTTHRITNGLISKFYIGAFASSYYFQHIVFWKDI